MDDPAEPINVISVETPHISNTVVNQQAINIPDAPTAPLVENILGVKRRPLPPLPAGAGGPNVLASNPSDSPQAVFPPVSQPKESVETSNSIPVKRQAPTPPADSTIEVAKLEHAPMPDTVDSEETRELFRFKGQQKVPLTIQGNLVVEVPVPRKLLAGHKNVDLNSTHLRYSAVCADPDTFQSEGYTLRQAEQGLSTEIFIVVTMYNEPHNLFMRTWGALVSNIQYLCEKKNSLFWDKDGWKKVIICIVSDGRENVNRKTLAVIGLLGAYQEGLIATQIESRKVDAHLFEYTTHVSLDADYKMLPAKDDAPPVMQFDLDSSYFLPQGEKCEKDKQSSLVF